MNLNNVESYLYERRARHSVVDSSSAAGSVTSYEETTPWTPLDTQFCTARTFDSLHNLTVPEIKKIRRSPATGRAAFWKNPEKSWSTFSKIQQHSGKCCDFFL